MTKNVDHRTRVQPGVKTGGQFAADIHSEPTGVVLAPAPAPAPLDDAAIATAAEMVRSRAAYEEGRWMRRQDKSRLAEGSSMSLPPELVELDRQAKEFESLPRQEQGEVLDKLKFAGAKHLLEPGQRLGNDRVQVADDLDSEEGNIGLALTAQKHISDAGLPGTVTLTHVGDYADFTVQDGIIKHSVRVGTSMLSYSAEPEDDSDYTRGSWLYRADASIYGGSVFEEYRAESLRKHFDDHHEYAVMMDVIAGSSFRDSAEHFGELDRGGRTAVLRTDGTESLLDVSGDEPVLKTDEGQTALHPSMVRGFLDHMAAQTGHPDTDSFVSDLREVFRETDRRLVR